MFVDEDGRFSLLFGGGGTGTSGIGVDASGGIAIDSKRNIGIFSTLGPAVGINLSFDIFGGFFTGDVCDLEGLGFNTTVSVLGVSVTIFGSDNGHLGFTVGLGPISPIPGVSVAPRTNTVVGLINK